jgi:beta-lactamase regulating signal transducer with metallopeptidase domain
MLLLLDHLWQSSVFAGGAGLLTLALHRNSASVRFWLWFAASVKFLVPFAALTALGGSLAAAIMPPLPEPTVTAMQPWAQPFAAPTPILATPGFSAISTPSHLDMTLVLIGLWGIGFAAIAIRWAVRWSGMRKLLRDAVELKMEAPVPIKFSSSRLEPGLVGILRPVILLPRGIEQQLSPPELDAVLAHELCHWRRRDNLLAAMHMLVEALFWFFPLVWWLGARLNVERERACDEGVLAGGNDPQMYAEGILKVCRVYLQSPLACVSGVSGADLKKRVERIVAERLSIPLDNAKKLMLAVASLGIVVLLSLGLFAVPTAIAQNQPSGPHPGTEAAVREQIAGWEKHQPVTSDMTAPMVAVIHQQQPTIQAMIDGLGPLKSVTFKGNTDNGADVYFAVFAHGSLAWTIAPLVGGKISGLGVSPAIVRSDNGPSPETEKAVRQMIAGFAANAPAYEIMSPIMFAVTQQQLKNLEEMAKELGPLQALTFKKINPLGWDSYDAVYKNGKALWSLQPLVDGKVVMYSVNNTIINDAKPHPDREASLRRYVESLEKGAPNYDEMTPTLAAIVRYQLPQTLDTMKALGPLRSITFDRGTANDTDVYLVAFEHGTVEWNMGPLTTDGKATRRGFRIL